jgi:hypothetical protein
MAYARTSAPDVREKVMVCDKIISIRPILHPKATKLLGTLRPIPSIMVRKEKVEGVQIECGI